MNYMKQVEIFELNNGKYFLKIWKGKKDGKKI